jgi:hypothetical protein
MKLLNTSIPSMQPRASMLPEQVNSFSKRNGSFELMVGKTSDVDAYLANKKKMHDTVGQLSLNANVVESAINFEYIPPNTHVLNALLPYIDLNQRTRNGAPGNDAAFVYPLKPPVKNEASNEPIHLGVYIDNKDLDNFLNYVGPDKWSNAVKGAPDKVTQFALEYAETVGKDSNKQPITLQDLSYKGNASPRPEESERSGGGFLDLFA